MHLGNSREKPALANKTRKPAAMSDSDKSDWFEIKDEQEFREWFLSNFCENLKQLLRELHELGVSDEAVNRDVLPKCSELYARDKALSDYRAMVERNAATKH
jgi:hypothetical protein